MGVDMSSTPPPPTSHTNKDLFSSPTLSLALAGIFNHAEQLGDEGSRECLRREDNVDTSSENSGPLISRSEDNVEGDDDDDDDDNDRDNKKKRRKKYHRHTAEQIREMEAGGIVASAAFIDGL